MKHIRSIPSAVCLRCWSDDPKPEGLCAKCVDHLYHEHGTDADSRPMAGRIFYSNDLPDLPGAA